MTRGGSAGGFVQFARAANRSPIGAKSGVSVHGGFSNREDGKIGKITGSVSLFCMQLALRLASRSARCEENEGLRWTSQIVWQEKVYDAANPLPSKDRAHDLVKVMLKTGIVHARDFPPGMHENVFAKVNAGTHMKIRAGTDFATGRKSSSSTISSTIKCRPQTRTNLNRTLGASA